MPIKRALSRGRRPMTAQPKIAMLAVLFAAMATTAVFNEIAISWYPPTWHGNGQWDYYEPADVRSCMGARLLASAGDNWGASH